MLPAGGVVGTGVGGAGGVDAADGEGVGGATLGSCVGEAGVDGGAQSLPAGAGLDIDLVALRALHGAPGQLDAGGGAFQLGDGGLSDKFLLPAGGVIGADSVAACIHAADGEGVGAAALGILVGEVGAGGGAQSLPAGAGLNKYLVLGCTLHGAPGQLDAGGGVFQLGDLGGSQLSGGGLGGAAAKGAAAAAVAVAVGAVGQVGHIVAAAQDQGLAIPESDGVLVIVEIHGGGAVKKETVAGAEYGAGGAIAVAQGEFGAQRFAAAGQEQLAALTDGAGVAVGDVHQIVLAVQSDDVPHMSAGAGAAGHVAGDGATFKGGVIESGQIAQILKSLGIAFANHIGGAVVVKNIHHLPGGVIVGENAVVGSIGVVSNRGADVIPVSHQFVIIALAGVGLDHGLGSGGGLGGCSGCGAGNGQTVTVHMVRGGVQIEGGLDHRAVLILSHGGLAVVAVPEHFIGMVGGEGVQNGVEVKIVTGAGEGGLHIYRVVVQGRTHGDNGG